MENLTGGLVPDDVIPINRKFGNIRFPDEVEDAIQIILRYARSGTPQDDTVDRIGDIMTRLVRDIQKS